MKLILQCAARKTSGAPTLSTPDGRPVEFVGQPHECDADSNSRLIRRPDDKLHFRGGTWRDLLVEYNASNRNPRRLLQAHQLYRPNTYRLVADSIGIENFYIISAGWGLVRSDFLLPTYNITFSNRADPCYRRFASDPYRDFNHLLKAEVEPDEPILYVGGLDYIKLHYSFTKPMVGRKIVFHASKEIPRLPDYEYITFRSFANWHYVCAEEILKGEIDF